MFDKSGFLTYNPIMLIEREIMSDILKWVPREEIVILIGPRQSGKTALLKLIQKKLETQGETVFFFNLEDQEILGYLNQAPTNILKLAPSSDNKKTTVILDEIQYLDNPTNFLKLIYDDHRENIKLIVSGSSAFYIDKKFKDSLAGRKRIFHILPLNFRDFLYFKGETELSLNFGHPALIGQTDRPAPNPIQRREQKRLMEEYMLFGGYPRVVLETDQTIKKELLEEILNSYVKKDAIEAGVRSQDKFFALLKILASQVGALVNETELSNTLGLSNTAIRHYLYVMQKSFHIHLLTPFFNNIRKEISRMPKVFLFDNGLRNKILNNFEPVEMRPDKGELFENLVFKILLDEYGFNTLKFWRSQSKNEVDFILTDQRKAVEVKYNFSLFKPKKYESFLSKYPEFSFHLFYHHSKDDNPKTAAAMHCQRI